MSLPGDSLIHFFDVLRLKGWTADDKRVQDDTDRPGINLKAVSVCSVEQYLWGNIVRRAADSLLPLARTLDKRGETKVTNLDVHIAIKEQVPKLQITMDHLVGVHVMAGTNELYHKESRFRLCEDTTTVEHIHERAIGTKLQSHVDILFILEAVDKPNDVGVV